MHIYRSHSATQPANNPTLIDSKPSKVKQMASSAKFHAVIAGVGKAGTGRSVALKFAKTYPVVLLARSSGNLSELVTEIEQAGGRAVGISADVSDPESVKTAFEQIEKHKGGVLDPDSKLAAAVYNVGNMVGNGPFLETTEKQLNDSLNANVTGLYNFSKKTIPQLLETVNATPSHPPTLIVTGATASVRGSAKFGIFAAGKFAVRALSQSLAREFGPRGVHVAHAVIDGGIDGEKGAHYTANGGVEDGKLKPEAIADEYWHLHTQHRSAFTQEVDLRPYVEKF